MSNIITISREFGSGGRELGKRLAEKLHIAYYDKEIIKAISERSGLAEEYVDSVMENDIKVYYPITFGRSFSYKSGFENRNKIVVAEQEIIKELGEKSDCVIVGRCADYILKEYTPLNLFVHANLESKIKRCRTRVLDSENISDKEIIKQIKKIDKSRAEYNEIFKGKKWGQKEDYHLCINTSNIEIKEIIPAISSFAKCWFKKNK